METRILTGYIARETDKAIAFVASDATRIEAKPLWIPRAKVAALIERDSLDVDIQLKGEAIHRKATPVTVEADAAFLEKVGA